MAERVWTDIDEERAELAAECERAFAAAAKDLAAKWDAYLEEHGHG